MQVKLNGIIYNKRTNILENRKGGMLYGNILYNNFRRNTNTNFIRY